MYSSRGKKYGPQNGEDTKPKPTSQTCRSKMKAHRKKACVNQVHHIGLLRSYITYITLKYTKKRMPYHSIKQVSKNTHEQNRINTLFKMYKAFGVANINKKPQSPQENILNTISHLGNVNENHNHLPPYTYYDGFNEVSYL